MTTDTTKSVSLPSDDEKLQFSLQQMFLTITIFAVMLALFRAFGIWGALLSFLSAFSFSVFLYYQKWPQRYFLSDLIWGAAIPIVCLVFDPGFFRKWNFEFLPSHGSTLAPTPLDVTISSGSIFVYTVLGYQILMLLIAMTWGQKVKLSGAYVAGNLALGLVIAMLIGIVLLPFSILGSFMFIGLMGFTPLLTARAFYRRMVQMIQRAYAEENHGRFTWLFLLGLFTAIVLPLLVCIPLSLWN